MSLISNLDTQICRSRTQNAERSKQFFSCYNPSFNWQLQANASSRHVPDLTTMGLRIKREIKKVPYSMCFHEHSSALRH